MSRVHDRDMLVAQLSRELSETLQPFAIVELAKKLMRAGTTLQRLAEAQCNGDWPADNGERKVQYCGLAEEKGCGSMWVPSVLKGKDHQCPDCRTQARVKALLAEYRLVPRFDGDPRGPVLRIFEQGVNYQLVENGTERGIYVS